MSLRLAGLGWVTPLGCRIDEVWENLCAGAEAEAAVISSSLGKNGNHFIFPVSSSAIAEVARYPRLRRSSAISRFAVVAGLSALRDAELVLDEKSAARTALVFAI
jgi:3-oxoacyl-[acyl-carrier-protein] synthase II